MSQLIVQSIQNKQIKCEKENAIEFNAFLHSSIEFFIIQHHKDFADISIFNFQSDNKKENICFIVSQDQLFNKKFKMFETDKVNDPKRTLDLFGNNVEQFQMINLMDLFNQIDKEQANFQLSFDGRDYSFKLVIGNKIKATLKKLDSYIESNQNNLENVFINTVNEDIKNNIKLNM